MSQNETLIEDCNDNFDFLADKREELEEKKMKLWQQYSLEEGDDSKREEIMDLIEAIEDELSSL